MTEPVKILVLGASYGLLPGIKLSLAGHAVTFVGRADEIAAMASRPIQVRIPPRHAGDDIILTAPVDHHASHGSVALRTPDDIDCTGFDLAILAMQEPHFAERSVTALMEEIAAARLPCLSIMNLPPPTFLARLGIDPGTSVHRSLAAWEGFDPAKLTLASPDPQAIRPDRAAPGQLQVTLASNFKAAPFEHAGDQALLQRLAFDMSHLKVPVHGTPVRPPVALLATDSLFAPLAKWPMLIAGNCRCVLPDGIRTIADAVLSDVATSAALYQQVLELARQLGATARDLVGFDAYAKAAARLTRPSSLAVALEAGAVHVERIDLLICNLMHARGMDTRAIDALTDRIEARLVSNRASQIR